VLSDYAREFSRVTWVEPNRLIVQFRPKYTVARSYCQRPEQMARIEQALATVAGRKLRVELAIEDEKITDAAATTPARPPTPQQRLMDVIQEPMIQRAEKLFGAQPIRVDEPSSRDD